MTRNQKITFNLTSNKNSQLRINKSRYSQKSKSILSRMKMLKVMRLLQRIMSVMKTRMMTTRIMKTIKRTRKIKKLTSSKWFKMISRKTMLTKKVLMNSKWTTSNTWRMMTMMKSSSKESMQEIETDKGCKISLSLVHLLSTVIDRETVIDTNHLTIEEEVMIIIKTGAKRKLQYKEYLLI